MELHLLLLQSPSSHLCLGCTEAGEKKGGAGEGVILIGQPSLSIFMRIVQYAIPGLWGKIIVPVQEAEMNGLNCEIQAGREDSGI